MSPIDSMDSCYVVGSSPTFSTKVTAMINESKPFKPTLPPYETPWGYELTPLGWIVLGVVVAAIIALIVIIVL